MKNTNIIDCLYIYIYIYIYKKNTPKTIKEPEKTQQRKIPSIQTTKIIQNYSQK